MDDTNSKTNPPAGGVKLKTDDQGHVVQQPTQTPPAPQVPTPISGGVKEQAPLTSQTPITEWVAPSTPEIVLPKEVKDAGVEARPLTPHVSDSARQQGVQMSHQNVPAPTVATESMGLTTPRSVLEQLKAAHSSVKEGLAWLVRLIIKEQDKQKNHPTDSRYN